VQKIRLPSFECKLAIAQYYLHGQQRVGKRRRWRTRRRSYLEIKKN